MTGFGVALTTGLALTVTGMVTGSEAQPSVVPTSVTEVLPAVSVPTLKEPDPVTPSQV